MTPAHAAVGAVKVVRVARGFPWLRMIAVVVLGAYVLWTYWVLPAIDRVTPWEGLAPSVPDMTPWDGIVPGAYGCAPSAPPLPRAGGFSALFHDVGTGLRSIASGPPSASTIKAWFERTGEGGAMAVHFVSGGLEGKPRPLGLAPAAPAPAPMAASAEGRLTNAQIAALATQAGWPAAEVPNVVARVQAESSGNPRARDYADGTHWGLLQLGEAERARYIPGQDAFDPLVNLKGARLLWEERGWQPWRASDGAVAAQTVASAPVVCPEDSGVMQALAPGEGSASVEAAIAFALSQRGKPYQWGAAPMRPGGAVPGSYDCSSLVQSDFLAGGIDLPGRQTTKTLDDIGSPVSGTPQRGDIVLTSTGHVGLALGDGTMVHAPRTGKPVQVTEIWSIYKVRRLTEATGETRAA